jgi:hypothetical protein
VVGRSWCSAGTMKTPLLSLHGSDHTLLLLLRGAVVLSSDYGEGRRRVAGARAGEKSFYTLLQWRVGQSTTAMLILLLLLPVLSSCSWPK